MKQIINKGDYFESMTEEQQQAGYIKFNIPDEDRIDDTSGEGVWGWVSPEDKQAYNDDNYRGKITAILLNTPLNYYGRLLWGSEVVLRCHGKMRPTLDPEWVRDHLAGECEQ